MVTREMSEEMPEKQEQTSHKVIEKRRRDRINNCLAELSQTVPAAFAKQSSGKLEKAEILEMTVEYLRAIQSTEIGTRFENGDWYSSDVWTDFMHHYQTGYSDCMRQIINYMSDVEGIDVNNTRCVRIVSYLRTRFRPDASVSGGNMYRNKKGSPVTSTPALSTTQTVTDHPSSVTSTVSLLHNESHVPPPTGRLPYAGTTVATSRQPIRFSPYSVSRAQSQTVAPHIVVPRMSQPHTKLPQLLPEIVSPITPGGYGLGTTPLGGPHPLMKPGLFPDSLSNYEHGSSRLPSGNTKEMHISAFSRPLGMHR
ncbi:unnamed protein product [Owenia fusiformis]|uniref:Hairy and enhancer of split-related protein HELT n=1 Tax=Owenia fusiformis TaxID=6347 RepID=A0A8J1UNV3_OWEFU|nr:unnamed protein product [Owenia fusiformis]